MAPSLSSPNSEASRKYSIACQRLSELKKNENRRKYRSYWIDCARTFEAIEKKYPATQAAGDACYERAGLYLSLYRFSKRSSDLSDSLKLYARCLDTYPKHRSAPEALYLLVDMNLLYKNDRPAAQKAYERLAKSYPGNHWTDKASKRLGLIVKRETMKHDRKTVPSPAAVHASSIGTVKAIRYWSGSGYTRVVIDVDRPFKFNVHELKDPDRLSFDIYKAIIAKDLNIHEPLPINDGILKQVRASQFDPDTVRVVLDLASLKSYKTFPLSSPDRLVIDVMGDESGASQAESISTQAEPKTEQDGREHNTGQTGEAQNVRDKERFSISEQYGLKIKTIAIDAGHGGRDPGAIGKNGLKEKDVTLDIAKRLAKIVKERLKCDVVMTRDSDVFVELDARPAIARAKKADLFVSIHTNASRKRTARGIETYIQGLQASDREAMATAARENAMTSKKLSELEDILHGLKMVSNDEDSIQLAHAVQSSLVENLRPYHSSSSLNLGVKRAFFYVLINTDMPSILVEVGFISNPEEERLLSRPDYRQKIAEALFEGIRRFVDSRSPKMAGL